MTADTHFRNGAGTRACSEELASLQARVRYYESEILGAPYLMTAHTEFNCVQG